MHALKYKMSYKFGDFTGRALANSGHPSGNPVPAAATMDRSQYPAVPKRPTQTHSKRSATIHHGNRKGVVVVTSPGEEVSNISSEVPSDYYLSDASGIAQMNANRHVVQLAPPQSEPCARGFMPSNISHSADNLASHAGIGADGSSSDEGEDMIGECFICYIAFDEDSPKRTPRNLQCGHAFCTSCLDELLRRSLNMTEIDCPLCHTVTNVHGRVVADLPKNYPLMSMIRSLDCSGKGRKISRKEEDSLLQPPQCPEHEDYLRSYCMKDGTLVCSTCVLYGSHRNHPTKFLNEAALSERKRLKELNVEAFKQKQRMKVALSSVQNTCKRVQETGGEMEDEVDNFFQGLIDLVEEKKRSVKMDIRMRTQLRVNALVKQEKELNECVLRAEAVNTKANGLLCKGVADFKLLSEVRLTLDQIEGIFTNPPPLVPKAKNDLKCSFTSDVVEDVADIIARSSTVAPDVVTIDSSKIKVESFHDGFRISWEEQSFADNPAISYHLQMNDGRENGYVNIYRGSATKCTWKANLRDDVTYKFRLQVRTTEGVGNWSQQVEAKRSEPSMRWHSKWRSVKVELSCDHLEAAWLGGNTHRWATFAADRLFEKNSQYYTEIEIVSLGKTKSKDKLAIGLISCKRTNACSVEWQNSKDPVGDWKGNTSWSFLPMSGLLKSHTITGEGVPYGQDLMIQAGDRIGMLVDLAEGKLTYFCNRNDLGVAFDDLEERPFLLAVSICDKVKVRLLFPPPPYHKRQIKVIQLQHSLSNY